MRKFKVSLEKGLSPSPYKHELAAAGIIADYLKSDILFLRRNPNASPDLLVEKTNQIWELKSPIGNGKRTIANNLRNASHQSKKVIIDLSRCKMNNENALAKINRYLNSGDSTLEKLLVIDKSKKVIDFFNKKA
ncbi:hypothetical protein IJU85_03190 [Candidatus Saccharibacteria bacterium]|nr:hypothetical protein [Candidatus Saccharibacteria bacterium]